MSLASLSYHQNLITDQFMEFYRGHFIVSKLDIFSGDLRGNALVPLSIWTRSVSQNCQTRRRQKLSHIARHTSLWGQHWSPYLSSNQRVIYRNLTNNREVTELCLMKSDPLAVMHFIVQKQFFKVSETLRTQNKMKTNS